MKVTLINYTSNALETLLFAKNTRLEMRAGSWAKLFDMDHKDKLKEIAYISNTIKSSWEFVDYTFVIEGVSRAFTHQFVRNRLGSYAQQTMRILNMQDFDYVTGPSIDNQDKYEKYAKSMQDINQDYKELIELGVKEEDARGVLPTNIKTNIMCKFNLRVLSDMINSRRSIRTQSEFRFVAELMENEVLAIHPWAAPFFRDRKEDAIKALESLIISDYEGTEGFLDKIKLIDMVRNG